MKNLNDEMGVLNEELRSDFSIEELDERLETDPLFLPNMLDVQGLENDGIALADVDSDGSISIAIKVEF